MVTFESGARIRVGDYLALRESVGWPLPRLSERELQDALDLTWNVTAMDRCGGVVGLGRLLDDGALYSTVWDMIVRPDLQRRGIGQQILERLIERTSCRTIVALVATPQGRPLYEAHGFRSESHGSVGMFLRPSTSDGST